ncbi:MAG: hypothetical protein K2X70_09570 [Candidatus Obscuribacterales bacterium]|jgi:tetratricopeptide (TPR) repeat protein|nr:hypothetical protein [Candidatus Obscuribacterales bacterium]
MERKTTLRKRVVVILTVLVGIASIAFGLHLYSWRDAQVEFYNRGLVAYRTGDVQQAIKFFDQSLSVYKSRVNREGWQERVLYPAPDRGMAAQAAFHKAKALLYARQAKPAVQAFQESLELNPGNLYQGRGLSQREVLEAEETAKIVKYDLELLFKNDPSQAQQQGKGKGKGQGKPDPNGKPVPSDDPGKQPGKGNRDAI